MQRRDLIKLAAVAGVARAQSHRFFTDAEFQMVDELTELIIPADEKSGGAKAAKVAEFIDMHVAEAFEDSERKAWREGLREIAKYPTLLDALTKLAANEQSPQTPAEHFFIVLKGLTVRGYYTSKIGIHDDLEYKGNVYQQGDYAGELP